MSRSRRNGRKGIGIGSREDKVKIFFLKADVETESMIK